MTQTMYQTRDTKTSEMPWRMPDADSAADNILNQALGFCAQKMRLGDAQTVIDRLQQGDRNACSYCHYSIAEQVSASLGALDKNVKAAYMFEHDATPEDICFSENECTPLVHLIVWVERKTEALNSLVAMLDRALAKRLAQLIGPRELQYVLDVQVIDDTEVERRTGYAALLSSIHHRPLKVWER